MKEVQNGPKISPLTTLPSDSPGFEAFHACDDSMRSWEYHSHDFYELYIHVKGAQYFCIDNDRYQLEPNVFILLPPFCMHGLAQSGFMKDYERAYLNLSSEMLRELGCGRIDLDSLFRSYSSHGKHMFQLTEEESERCVAVLDSLQAAHKPSTSNELFRCCSEIISFLSILCDVITRSETISAVTAPNTVMQQVLTYINSNYTQPITMSDLAHRFNISVSYLSHEFSRYTRRSVYDYILYRRIMLAREMITSPLSLNSIAYQCGFNDYSNFLRSFNKLVGMTPRAYRDARRNQTASH